MSEPEHRSDPAAAALPQETSSEALLAEQLRLVSANVPVLVAVNIVSSLVLLFFLRDVTTLPAAALWTAILWGVTALRFGFDRRFCRPGIAPADSRWIARALVGLAALSGGTWGAGIFLIDGPNDLFPLFIATALIVGMAMGALASLSLHPPIYLGFATPLCILLAAGLALRPEPETNSLVVSVAIIFVTSLLMMRNTARAAGEALRLRFDNLRLVGELRAQTEAAHAANRAKSRFMAAASHDLRQPLHALGFLLAALRQERSAERRGALLEDLDRTNDNLTGLFDHLLEISRLEAGAIQPQPEPLDLADLLAPLIAEFRPQIGASRLQLDLSDSQNLTLVSDPVLLARILRNLLSNAAKFAPKGTVRLTVQAEARHVLLRLRDEGIGMSEGELEQIFEEYYQAGNAERDRSNGLGLGLAIVRHLCRLLEGEIRFTSAPGKGTEVTLRLPRQPATRSTSSDVAASVLRRPGSAPAATATIVVIDDDDTIRRGVARVLADSGFDHCTAASGGAARRQLVESGQIPDLLVVDYHLPNGERGPDVIELLRDEFNRTIPTILITGDAGFKAERLHGLTDVAVLYKPVAPTRLLSAIRDRLARDDAPAIALEAG